MIRKATNIDTEEIARTYEELLHYEERNGSNSNWQLGIYPTIQIPLSTISKGTMYVLEEQGEICASMVLNKEQPIEYQQIDWHYLAEAEKVMVIHTLCIPPQKAGKGYGNQMVRFSMQLAKEIGCKVIRIDTWAGNKPAAVLYQKMGFHIAGYGHMLLHRLIDEEQVYMECEVQK